jgi:hypothetical protein
VSGPASVSGHISVALGHAALDVDGAPYRVNHADEFHQHPIPGRLDDAAPMLGDLGVDQVPAMPLELAKRPLVVGAHQPAIAGHIAGQDGSKSSFDARFVHEDCPA